MNNPENDNDQNDPSMKDEFETQEEAFEKAEKEMSASEKQLHEAREQVLRAHAEMANIRQRASRDVANAHRYALEQFIDSLLPVIDSLERALHHSHDNEAAKAIHEGVDLTMKMFIDVLQKVGIEQVNPVKEKFNPQLHEAISMIVKLDVEPNTVIDVFQKGYLLNGRLVRPARVVLAKAE
jgi:molecular chaperone GrpE